MAFHDYNAVHYRKVHRQFEVLAEGEEFVLAKQWRDQQDKKALDRLVNAHTRLVHKIANGYKGYGLPLEDLIAEGQIGIMQATKHFDPDKGYKFATYATWWIKAVMQDYVMRSWSLVKVGTTSAQRKLFFNLRRMKNQLDGADDNNNFFSDEKMETIAHRLNVQKSDVQSMYQRLSGSDSSLNAPLGNQEESKGEWIEWVSDEHNNHEEMILEKNEHQKRKALFEKALHQLKPRQQHVIIARRLQDPPKTLEEVGKELDLTSERIRQIENEAFEKLRTLIKKALIK